MSIEFLKSQSEHPARTAAIKSMTCVQNKDREGWLSMWAEDGIIEDPVGASPLDPEGNGHQGIEKITAFWEAQIAPADLRFSIRQSYACGNECANVGTITSRMENGTVSRTELVMVYRIDDAGKVLSLRAFWEFEDTVASMY